MKSLFSGVLFGFLCFSLAFCGRFDANASKVCCNSHADSLLICDEFSSIFESKKYLCIISYSNECPISKAYIKTIQNLVKQFGDTVQFCLLDPGVGSRSITGMENLLFHDNRGVICGRFGIDVYPQAVVFNCLTRSNIYSGKIDDRAVSLGVIPKIASKKYLFNVLTNVTLGKPNTVTSNEAVGCFIGPFDAIIE